MWKSVCLKTLLLNTNRSLADMSSSSSQTGTADSFGKRLQFDNSQLRRFPVETNTDNYVRKVSNAFYSRVKPTPLANPRLVGYSVSALNLLDLNDSDVQQENFVELFAGNQLWTGSDPAAHCYCGHQFGVFAGQLGDGAAISLGEVINSKNERWELQLKGAGLTPYSRMADGRKVLRSSIREFLCSEAMFYLNVPTTRAATCIVSTDTVIRDALYDGNARSELCAVISRIAPSFCRFGTFENFKTLDATSGKMGGCIGRMDLMHSLFDYLLDTFYVAVRDRHALVEDANERRNKQCVDFFEQVVQKTAELVAKWQAIGFCHGVLNTDNMSIIGLTLDYGPFAFMERFDPILISNWSDNNGHYSFDRQPMICQWNLLKLSEMLLIMSPSSLSKFQSILGDGFGKFYFDEYLKLMKSKFGLKNLMTGSVQSDEEKQLDREFINNFQNVLYQTGSDYTNCFRLLSRLNKQQLKSRQFDDLLKSLLAQRVANETFVEQLNDELQSSELQLYESIIRQNNVSIEDLPEKVRKLLNKKKLLLEVRELNREQKTERDKQLWIDWLKLYCDRIEVEFAEQIDTDEFWKKRSIEMNQSNPEFVLRNHVLQSCIEEAEKGNFNLVNQVFRLIQSPFAVPKEIRQQYCNWFRLNDFKVYVSCSS